MTGSRSVDMRDKGGGLGPAFKHAVGRSIDEIDLARRFLNDAVRDESLRRHDRASIDLNLVIVHLAAATRAVAEAQASVGVGCLEGMMS